MKLYKTDEWHEDMGDCIFFAFLSFEEPPQVYCGTPLDDLFYQFKDMFAIEWTHFVRVNFNEIFAQAISSQSVGNTSKEGEPST